MIVKIFFLERGIKIFLWGFRFLTWELGLEVSSRELKKISEWVKDFF